MYLNKFQQQKLIQGQSGFISLCLRLHVSTGTSNLPTAAFSLSTALFMRFTFLYSLLRKLFKDEYGRNSRCFWKFTEASAQTVEILCVHLFDNVMLFIFSLTTTNTTWQWWSVSQLVLQALLNEMQYGHNRWTCCYSILYRHSWSPEGEACRLGWYHDLSSGSTVRVESLLSLKHHNNIWSSKISLHLGKRMAHVFRQTFIVTRWWFPTDFGDSLTNKQFGFRAKHLDNP